MAGNDGGVGIVCCAGRGNQTVFVKALVEGGPADRSGTVQPGHQIIAIDNKDVTGSSLDDVAQMLRGAQDSTVSLRLLETREIHMEMERTEETDEQGSASIGVVWKKNCAERIVERVPHAASGPAAPRKGDRLVKIEHMPISDLVDDDIARRLEGTCGTFVHLSFARGVAHHSVTLTRRALSQTQVNAALEGGALHQNQPNPEPLPPTVIASSTPTPGGGPQHVAPVPDPEASRGRNDRSGHSSSGGNNNNGSSSSNYNSNNGGGVPPLQSISPSPSKAQRPPPPPGPPPPKPAQAAETAQWGDSSPGGVRDGSQGGAGDDTVRKQLVDIARKLKDEVEAKAHEVLALKASHKKEISELQDQVKVLSGKISSEESSSNKDLAETREKLGKAQAELERKDQELASVKGVLTRRAEAVLNQRAGTEADPGLDRRVEQLTEERDALKDRLREAKAQAAAQSQVRGDMDAKSLRAAADSTLRWQIQEVEGQLNELRQELVMRAGRDSEANETIRIQAQALIKEKQRIESLEQQVASLQEQVRISQEGLETARGESGNKESALREVSQARDKAIERCGELEARLSDKSAALDAEVKGRKEDKEAHEAAQQGFETQQALFADEVSELGSKVKAAEEEARRSKEAVAEAEAKLEERAEEIAALKVKGEEDAKKITQAEERAEKLTDATHAWREQLEDAQKVITAQSNAYTEERKCTEDATKRADMLQGKLESKEREMAALEGQVREIHSLREANNLSNAKLRSFEAMQQQIVGDSRQRQQQIAQMRGMPPLPYQQLMQMLEEGGSNIAALHAMVAARDQQVAFLQQKSNELARVWELAQDAEQQVMRLKESNDWKVIAVQQISAAVDKCIVMMRSSGVDEDEIAAISASVAVSCSHASAADDSTGSGAPTQRSAVNIPSPGPQSSGYNGFSSSGGNGLSSSQSGYNGSGGNGLSSSQSRVEMTPPADTWGVGSAANSGLYQSSPSNGHVPPVHQGGGASFYQGQQQQQQQFQGLDASYSGFSTPNPPKHLPRYVTMGGATAGAVESSNQGQLYASAASIGVGSKFAEASM